MVEIEAFVTKFKQEDYKNKLNTIDPGRRKVLEDGIIRAEVYLAAFNQ